MAYGIQIFGSDGGGSYTVGDTSLSGVNYAVVASGTATGLITNVQNDTATGKGYNYLFIKPNASAHVSNYQYTREANLSSQRAYFGYSTTSNDQYGAVTSHSVNNVAMDYLWVKDMTHSSTNTGYGIELKDVNGETYFDTREAVSNSSFELTNYAETGTVSGNFGTIYSGSDYLSKYVDSRPLFSYQRTFPGQQGSIFFMAAYRWINNTIQFYYIVDIGTGGPYGNTTNTYNNPKPIWVGEVR